MSKDKLNKTWYRVAALILIPEQDWQFIGQPFETINKAQDYIEKDKKSGIPFNNYVIVEHSSQIIQ